MKTTKVNGWKNVPKDFTGIVEHAVNGNKYWYKNGKYHREDGPAVEYLNGTKNWYKNGKYHREDGPAVERSNGNKYWYKEGNLHREDGPACELWNGTKYWYKDGEIHREDGPAVCWDDGLKEWWLDGKKSSSEEEWKKKLQEAKEEKPMKEETKPKEDSSPQIVYTDKSGASTINGIWWLDWTRSNNFTGMVTAQCGSKHWFKEGLPHREDGPASEFQNGAKHWWLDGKQYLEEEWKKKLQKAKEEKPMKEETKPKEDSSPQIITVPHTINEVWLLWARNNKFTGIAKGVEGSKHWFKEGLLHREDGPASEFSNGNNLYYINGLKLSKEEFVRITALEQFNKLENKVEAPFLKEVKKLEQPTFIDQAKGDLRQAGIRIACRKSVSVVKETLINLLSLGKTNKETKSIRSGITALFESEYGKGLIGYLMGQLLPIVKEKFPEKYQPVMEELATEFRVEGLAIAGGSALTALGGLLTLAKGGMMDSMNSLLEDTGEKIRVLDEKESLNELTAKNVSVKHLKEEELVEPIKDKKEEKIK